MIIGVDASCWANQRGYGRYTRELLSALFDADQRNEYRLFIDAESAKQAADLPEGIPQVRVSTSEAATQAASADGRRSLRDIWAIRQAVNVAQGDIIIEFPPDGNSLPEKIPQVIAAIEAGKDFVIVSRYKDGAKSYDDDFMTAIGNKLFTALTNLIFGTKFTDVLVGYRAYRKEHFDRLNLDADGLSWVLQEAVRFGTSGCRVGEIGGDEPERVGGERKMRVFKTGWEILVLMFREYRIMKNERRHA